jgi:hypothetical protein
MPRCAATTVLSARDSPSADEETDSGCILATGAQIYKCQNPSCERPGSYRSYSSDKEVEPPCEVPGCGGKMKLLRWVLFLPPLSVAKFEKILTS